MKFLLALLRLPFGVGRHPRILGVLGVLLLVLLRVTIGWHFLSEGLDKRQAGDWDSKPFFENARGPFAEHFHAMVYDWEGDIRFQFKDEQNAEPASKPESKESDKDESDSSDGAGTTRSLTIFFDASVDAT
ncbi:MAG: hypothetical protein AAFN70_07325, partial [Planctomycetota bacterium]